MAIVDQIMSMIGLGSKPETAKPRAPRPAAGKAQSRPRRGAAASKPAPRSSARARDDERPAGGSGKPSATGSSLLPAPSPTELDQFGSDVRPPATLDSQRFIEPGRKVTIPNPAPADQRVVMQILSYVGGVLTADGGVIRTTEEQRSHCAVLENGYLLVPKTDPINQHVMAVRALIARLGVRIEHVWLVDLDVIRKVYDLHDRRSRDQVVGGDDQLRMQRAFVDLVKKAAAIRASDIDMIVNRDQATVRLRVQGVIQEIAQLTPQYAHQLASAAWDCQEFRVRAAC